MKQLLPEQTRSRFQPLGRNRPEWLMSRHPSERIVVLQTTAGDADRAAVWDEESGQLLWQPEHTTAMSWSPDGKHVLSVTDQYAKDRSAEHSHSLDLWVWPERKLVASWPLDMPGWCHDLVMSPIGTDAAMTWLEQDGAGFFHLRLDLPIGQELPQENADYEYTDGNLLVGPVFSPGGRYLVASCSRWCWWAPDRDPETPSPGGRFKIGHVVVFDCLTWEYREVDVEASIDPGWSPQGAGGDLASEIMGGPEFVDDDSFRITLPTGTTTSFRLSEVRP